eukprot:CAMPEP_0203667670 /NCGR_PEP_ID=MMETSP0090-20130426/4470_1 /ASSEMBLY_ACC=CAM_ASM_001088 /TAXON_ID=426623 /ORGANISM="Chaetoceros affinis, Strain CCMP159" /LENGTH=306 /DNA_ID=CAMNT_0050531905 /DNA_START=109 /DNA_END=1026 /DNA_ORIENTATION=+
MRVYSTALSLLLATSTCRTSAFGSLSKSSLHSSSSSRGLKKNTAFTRSISSASALSLSSHHKDVAVSAFITRNANRNMSLSLLRGGGTETNTGARSSSNVALNSAVSSETEESTESVVPVEYFRSDYKALPNVVSNISMNFDIRDGKTTVTSEMKVESNPNLEGDESSKIEDLVLDGDETAVKLMALQLDGRDLVEGDDYEIKPGQLIIKGSSLYGGGEEKSTTLKTVVEIVPEENTQLSGLYKSGPMYCTQCEAMGFRRITYYPDRPDNMAVFEKVTIEADKSSCPVLLSNGNFVESGDVEGSDG